MTSTRSPRLSRGASLAMGGMFLVTSSLLFTPLGHAAPATDAVDAINDRYSVFGGEGSLLGAPVGEAVDITGGAERDYEGGVIYYSKDTGAHVMYGEILKRFKALGGPDGSGLGFPKNDESDTGDGVGRFNDFSAPEGASIYWTPQWGASVIKGKVLEAWRQSGGITGPFGYPSADTSITDDVQTGKFVGPEGTEIQWSKAGGLITIPAALADKIPGFSASATTGTTATTAEGTTSVSKPSVTAPALPEKSTKSSKWWWIPVGLALLALLGGLLRLLTRKRPEPVKVVAPEVKPVVKTPPPAPRPAPVRPAPVVKAPPPAPKPPAPPRPPAPAPAKVVPLAKATPPPAPKPVTPPPPPPRPAPLVETPKATIHEEVHHDVAPVIRYESSAPAETTIQVTYENNAVGDDQESRADKSDTVPDSQQL